MLDRVNAMATDSLISELDAEGGLDEPTRTMIMMDFEIARSSVQLSLGIKMDFWGRFPWKLCGLAHHEPSVARKIASEARQMFWGVGGRGPYRRRLRRESPPLARCLPLSEAVSYGH